MLNELAQKTTVADRTGAENFPHGGKNRRPPRVLVIDDEPLLRWSVAATLEEEGCQVTEAVDVESAMAAFSEVADAAGIVFLDPRWPDADGLQVLSDLHRLSPTTPIILMTAYGTPELVELARRLGAFAVIDKPFDVGDLIPLVERASTHAAAPRTAGRTGTTRR
jgi:DNA-binding NtrC family response regulator